MGLFNYIYADCPECGEAVEFQSKSGSCTLASYHITNMPVEDFAGIVGDFSHCGNCGYIVEIKDNQVKPFDNFAHHVG